MVCEFLQVIGCKTLELVKNSGIYQKDIVMYRVNLDSTIGHH